jgi:hypothetical protein
MDLEFPETPSALTQKIAKGVGEFETYISEQRGVHSKLRRMLLQRRDDQHCVRGIDRESGD